MCVADEVIEQFTPTQATEQTPLVIKVRSPTGNKFRWIIVAMVADLFSIAGEF